MFHEKMFNSKKKLLLISLNNKKEILLIKILNNKFKNEKIILALLKA